MPKEKKSKKEEKQEEDSEEEIIEEESELEINEEDLEQIIESLEDNSLNEFLANQWRPVALNERNSSPVLNLENDLPRREFNEDETKIEYDISKLSEQGKYLSLEKEDYEDKNVFEQEEVFREQKRLYAKPTKLSSAEKIEEDSGMKYVKPEDTFEKNYLTKKKFSS